ncbi:MAG: hypothetical protein HYY18_14470 [Planctomycetes bacterium]|nr:hypothetical protein [Planctomycetota bacterium]
MKLRCVLCVGLAAMLAGLALMARAEDKKEEVTIKGEVVDMACWLEEGKMGPDHAKCAKGCVSGGTPAGIVTEDGSVYLVVVHGKDGKSPLSHVAEMVEVKGHVVERGGIKGIVATSCTKVEAKGEGSEGSHK